jgi:membrane-associated phospholipid phosphatase
VPDPNWYPLGAQATNTRGPNFTPPFPAYVSGHATIGGALFQVLRHYYPDKTSFVFVSDEWNGVNKNVDGKTRPLIPYTFASLSEAESRNAESRVYLGVHWQFDSDQGIIEGNHVADWVWGHAFLPIAAATH